MRMSEKASSFFKCNYTFKGYLGLYPPSELALNEVKWEQGGISPDSSSKSPGSSILFALPLLLMIFLSKK
jgi:hypothetical protein